MDVVGALHRARDGDAAVRPRLGDHGLVLDVELLLVADPVLTLDDEAGAGQRGVHIAASDLVGRELLLGREGVEDRWQRLRAQGDAPLRLPQRGLVRRGNEGHGLGMVADDVRGEGRHVRLDGAHDVLAGDVGGGHDHDAGPVEGRVAVDAEEPRMGLRRSDRRAVPGAREHEVIGVASGAGELLRALAAERRWSGPSERRQGLLSGSRRREDHWCLGGDGPARRCRRRHDRRLGQGPWVRCRWIQAGHPRSWIPPRFRRRGRLVKATRADASYQGSMV